MKKIFKNFDVSLETMIRVEETVPDLWGKERWEEHLAAEAEADTLGF